MSNEQSVPLREPGASLQDFQAKSIDLKIYDVSGRLIKSFTLSPAPLALCVVWNGDDDHGRALPSGAYMAVLTGDGKKIVKKVVVSR